MAEPNSSIKSIFSGKISLSDLEEDEYASQANRIRKAPSTLLGEGWLPGGDGQSVSSQNLRYMASEYASGKNEFIPTSTNMSVASSWSDYQHPFGTDRDDYSLGTSQAGTGERFSRPASRNSTTSCFSTTATKDGVEGKRIHRHGPSPYFANVINNMVHLQQQQYQQVAQRAGAHSGTEDTHRPKKADIDALAQPPVTIQEKLVLMNGELLK
ncbi:hypothetical protein METBISCDRAFT_26207 [Metschnikowia bicuspidata]|uniref:Uncharacterized protein n=1 Tax=Metschnikowia bicuspidata TaxID=27322 RepID=A0A4P9ZFU3_9ASCO|nr:hypothetical protein METBISCDRAFT_26207 [Metschnikowia bicuspidata]